MASKNFSPTAGAPAKIHRNVLPRWRIFTWVILAFNLIMLIWAITGGATGEDCGGKTGEALTTCEAGNVGTGIGVILIIVLWALGDIILGVLWLITKPRKRDCPACGNSVKKGVMQCRACGYDFQQLLQPRSAGEEAPPSGPGEGWSQR